MNWELLTNAARWFFIMLDKVVFWAIEKIYGLFTMIAETGVFTPEVISTFASRIYVLLGVFMLFKVTFSLITYIINPDTMTDKKGGMGSLVKRAIIVLVGIVAVPYVFQAAYSLQSIVLKDNIIGSIILGREASNLDEMGDGDYIEKGGRVMSHTIFTSFITLNSSVVGNNCAKAPIKKDDDGYYLNPKCDHEVFQTEMADNLNLGQLLVKSYEERDAGLLINYKLVSLTAKVGGGIFQGQKDYVFDYSILFSTLTGGLLAWILMLFCIDVGLRSVKLGFLQLVAPIPVISYIEPKGEKIFQKWLSECTKTYLDLFIRLIAIYFVVYVVVILQTTNTYSLVTGERQENLLVNVFIILGALMFAKQLPDLISNILGIKLSGGFTLSPMNKLQQVPLVGAGATNLFGRMAGAAAAAIHDQTGNKWRAAASGWFAAGDALHGKVPLMGAKPGASTVRSIHTGREAGFEVATGSKMKTHSFINDLFRQRGIDEITDLKKKREPLQQELNNINLHKQDVADAYNYLQGKLATAKTPEEAQLIKAKMEEAKVKYSELSTREAAVSGDIGTINDQIKDLEKAYHIDKSPKDKVQKVGGKVESTGDGKYQLKDKAYGDSIESFDRTIPTTSTDTSSTNSIPTSGTVGGVEVTTNSNGEKTTGSGIILPGNIKFDK